MSFNVPTPIREAFEAVAKPYSVKEKWAVCSAAILLLVSAGEEIQRELFRAMKAADFDDVSMKDLIDAARAGDLYAFEPAQDEASRPTRSAGMPLKRAAKPVPRSGKQSN